MMQLCNDKLLIFHLLLLMSVLACEMSEVLTFTAHERGKVEIRCPYKSGYEGHKKYLCRGECPTLNKDKLVESESAAKDERFSLNDNKSAHIFTVTITDLRTEDQDQYWCGIKTGLFQFDYNREIYLEIKHVSRVSGVTGDHLKITCCYESELKNNVKFICKESSTSLCEKSAIKVSSENKITSERMSSKPTTKSFHTSKPATTNAASNRSITSSSSSSVLTFFSSSANAASPNPQSDFTPIIILSVMWILMVFGFLLFIFFRCTQKKEGVWLRGDVHVFAEYLSTKEASFIMCLFEATHTVCYYEEITDNHSDYSLGLPVFDERESYNALTYSTIIFQTTNYSDRTSDGPKTSNS